MAQATSIQRTLSELRKHAEGSGDNSLLDLVIEMEAKLAENGAAINVGNISNSTAVAIGNGIDIVVHQSNVPEALVTQLKDLLTALGKPAAAPSNWTRGKSPFPGLRAFDEEYAPVFFGRTAETEQLLARLSKPDCRFLMVVGASGSGKSSLVRAGLIPRLREGALHGSENWKIITFTPDAFGKGDPFDVLAYELHQAWSELNIQKTASHLRDSRSGLREVLENALSDSEPHAVLVIDQFEEIFSRVIDEDLRRKFQASISEATNSPRILTIATLRDDFFHYCVKSPILSRLINRNDNSTFTLSAPGQLELYEMINGPARVAGLKFENGLVRKILEDTGSQPGVLALMAYALDLLHKASGRDGTLKFDDYQSFGGVQGAIGTRAQETFNEISEEAQKTLPRVFRELLEVDESGTATRKRTPLEQVERDAPSRELVQALIQDRLLMTSRGADNNALVEVAHEALFRSWDKLNDWIEATQDDHILLRQVRTAAEWWDKHGCKPEYLWPDERLKPVYEMGKRLEPSWEEHEKEFIRLEVERLVEELEDPTISHVRRLRVGERLNDLNDPRPGVGLVTTTLPLYTEEGAKGIAALREGEMRLWGDKPEHIGLPDLVWLKVDGGSQKIKEQTFKVQPFLIAKYPITYRQFEAFVEAEDGFYNPCWWDGISVIEKHKSKHGEQNFKLHNHPSENVSWYDSIAFCRWVNSRLGWAEFPANLTSPTLGNFSGLRLPTEWEWQWAAGSGNSSYEYPWGNEWDGSKANTSKSGLARTTAVGMYPAGSAKCGALDMSGNVWEWCLNEFDKLENISLSSSDRRVVRGGTWDLGQGSAGALFRNYGYQVDRNFLIGFRLVVRPAKLQG